jgi:hypothetical protein
MAALTRGEGVLTGLSADKVGRASAPLVKIAAEPLRGLTEISIVFLSGVKRAC